MTSVYIKTLGCKVNSFDSHAILNQFQQRGCKLTDEAAGVDVTIINTCSVTHAADREARHLIRRYRRSNPNGMLVVTGCYAQTDSARLAAMEEVDFVIPNAAKEDLANLVLGRMASKTGQSTGTDCLELTPVGKLPPGMAEVKENRQGHFKASATLFDRASSSRARTFVKIQDGCNGFCAYCLIPYARGASRSVEPHRILEEIRRLTNEGTGEIILTGIHIGDYGRDLDGFKGGETPFSLLLKEMLTIPNIPRIRISSLEPAEVTDDLLAVFRSAPEYFCDHFHLPLQSGSDSVLTRMRRTYNCERYLESVASLRDCFPNACIGADVIPGFPGETALDHQSTIDMVHRANLAYLHVFPYSKRPNTAAARMPDHIPPEVVKERSAALRQLSTKQLQVFSQKFLGDTLEVVWEDERDRAGRQKGHARNYLTVYAPRQYNFRSGDIAMCKIKGLLENGVLGVPA